MFFVHSLRYIECIFGIIDRILLQQFELQVNSITFVLATIKYFNSFCYVAISVS